MARWENGWRIMFGSLAKLSDVDLAAVGTIRGEPHSVHQAPIRVTTHAAYHVGQILYIARGLNPEGAWLTIPPGQSKSHRLGFLK